MQILYGCSSLGTRRDSKNAFLIFSPLCAREQINTAQWSTALILQFLMVWSGIEILKKINVIQ